MRLRTHLLVIAAAALVAGCGDDPEQVAGPAGPVATATAAETVPPVSTDTATPAAERSADPTPPPAATEEGGDEDGNRPGLQFDLLADSVAPDRLEAPAFLGLRIRLRNRSGETRAVRLDEKPLVELAAGEEHELEVEGLQPGEHTLDAGAGGRATIVAERAG